MMKTKQNKGIALPKLIEILKPLLKASEKNNRKSISRLYDNGETMVATDGRLLIALTGENLPFLGTRMLPMVHTMKGGTFPDGSEAVEGFKFPAWQQVIPKTGKGSGYRELEKGGSDVAALAGGFNGALALWKAQRYIKFTPWNSFNQGGETGIHLLPGGEIGLSTVNRDGDEYHWRNENTAEILVISVGCHYGAFLFGVLGKLKIKRVSIMVKDGESALYCRWEGGFAVLMPMRVY